MNPLFPKRTSVLALVLAFAGVWLLVVAVGWLAAIGVFLMLWGNNIGLIASTERPSEGTRLDSAAVWDAFQKEACRQARATGSNPFDSLGEAP